MNRWHRALQGFATDLAGTVLVTVAGFVATPIILSLTSQSLYGFWVLTLSIVGYMALLEFGVGMALTRHVASDIESRTPKELNALIATAFSFLSILGAGLFLVGFICSFFVPGWLGVPEGDRQDVVVRVLGGARHAPRRARKAAGVPAVEGRAQRTDAHLRRRIARYRGLGQLGLSGLGAHRPGRPARCRRPAARWRCR